MDKKIHSGIMLTLLLVGMLTLAFNIQLATASLRVHNIDTGEDFAAIQEAIDDPDTLDGHTILVDAGTYYENVVVDKSLSLIGENKTTTMIDGLGTGIVFDVTANNVTITKFTIRNAWWAGIELNTDRNIVMGNNIVGNYPSWTGIILRSSRYNTIAGNIVTKYGYGILILFGSTNNNVSRNTITDNWYDIDMAWSGGNILRDNELSGSRYSFGVYGDSLSDFLNDIDTSNTINGKPIYYMINQKDVKVDPITFPQIGYLGFVNSTRITVKDLSLTRNIDGILLAHTSNSTVENINAYDNQYGIKLIHSNTITVGYNTITKHSFGILLEWSSHSIVSGNKMFLAPIYLVNSEHNILSNNTLDGLNLFAVGISLDYSRSNIITENVIANNELGLDLRYECGNNAIYHNSFINNAHQVNTIESINTWDDGYPSSGNHWSDYSTRYPDVRDEYHGENQDIPGCDGVWDHPYEIDADNIDNYPLVEPWSPLPKNIGELRKKIEELWLEDAIDNQGIVKSLVAKLNAAQKLIDKGKIDEAKSILEEDFIPQVQNLSGIHITLEAAEILIESAEYILSNL